MGGFMSEGISVEEIERQKAPWGEVTLVGLGRIGLRTALILMQSHRGGPRRIVTVDGQTISPDDLIFRTMGGEIGEYKVKFFQNLAPAGFSKEITGITSYVSDANMADVIAGDVVCIEIAGGDTLPLTTKIIKYAQQIGAVTISTMGVFGVGDVPVLVSRIEDADQNNPIVSYLTRNGITNHILIGTGKLIRDWEPVIPPVLDRVSLAISSEILKQLHKRQSVKDNI
jgi:predicted ThiF/HesA family dinucleotide-utilizing enzyme